MKYRFSRNPKQAVVGIIAENAEGEGKIICKGACFSDRQARIVKRALEEAFEQGRVSLNEDVQNMTGGITNE